MRFIWEPNSRTYSHAVLVKLLLDEMLLRLSFYNVELRLVQIHSITWVEFIAAPDFVLQWALVHRLRVASASADHGVAVRLITRLSLWRLCEFVLILLLRFYDRLKMPLIFLEWVRAPLAYVTTEFGFFLYFFSSVRCLFKIWGNIFELFVPVPRVWRLVVQRVALGVICHQAAVQRVVEWLQLLPFRILPVHRLESIVRVLRVGWVRFKSLQWLEFWAVVINSDQLVNLWQVDLVRKGPR